VSVIIAMLSIVAAVVPLTAALLVCWWMDRYEREPLGRLLLAFAWGAFGATTISLAVSLVLRALLTGGMDEAAAQSFAAIVIAPLVEEPAKALAMLPLIAGLKAVDNVTDGILYGVAVGLGFAVVENFLYFVSLYAQHGLLTWLYTVVMRTLFTASLHALASATLGAFLGFAWQRALGPGGWLAAAGLGMALAMAIHALWNFLAVASSMTEQAGFHLLGILLVMAGVVAYFVLLQVSLWLERRLIFRELTEEARHGVIRADHPHNLTRGLFPRPLGLRPGVRPHDFASTAVRLAFLRSRWKYLSPAARARSHAELERLRQRLRELG
jgi:RsiW-degrading membrane proteinase PrsW (M82 family)